jgi:hypothetical protein
MGNATTWAMCPSVRSRLNTGVAVASAGILALGLLTAPPDVRAVRSEVREVRLAALALPPAPYWDALQKFISSRAQTVIPVAPVVKGGASDINTAADSTVDLAADPQQAVAPALTATTTGFDFAAIFGPLINNAIVGPIVLFGAIAFGLFVILPIGWFVGTIYEAFASVFGGILGLPATLPLPGTVGALAATAPTPASDALLSDSVPPTETREADVSARAASKDVTETANDGQGATGPTEVSADEPSATDPASESATPTQRPKTPRPVVRDSLVAGEQVSDTPHPGKGGRPTSRAAAAVDDAGKPGSSSAAAQSDDSHTTGRGATDGDAGDSE